MNIKVFAEDPRDGYCFSSDEHTVLVWPEATPPGMDASFRCREHNPDSPEVLDYRVWGYEIPTTLEDFQAIMENIRTGDWRALEMCDSD